MNRKMSAVSNTHTKITAIERVILNKETIDAPNFPILFRKKNKLL